MSRRRVLTEEMVSMRTKCNRMDLIKNLNLWGNDLEDISVLQYMPNLEVLSLSVNAVSSLADLRYCPKLSELYLRKNEIRDLAEVLNLRHLRQMRVLWLSDNPCATLPYYRQYVLHHLPNLTKFDSQDVSEEERRQAKEADLGSVQTCVADVPHDDAPSPDLQEFPSPAVASSPLSQSRRGFEREFEPLASEPAARRSQPRVGSRWFPPGPELPLDKSAFPEDKLLFEQRSFDDDSPIRADAQAERPITASTSASSPQWQPRHRPSDSGSLGSGAGVDGFPPSASSPQWQPRHRPSDSGSPGSCAGVDGAAPRASGAALGAFGGYGHSPAPPRGNEAAASSLQPLTSPDNILCAVLSLVKELDAQGLELVRRAVEPRQE